MKIYNSLFLFAFVLLFASCSSVVEGINDVDPNSPSDSTPDLMMTGVQLGNVQFHEGELARLTGMWNGYFTGSDRQYVGLQTYGVTAGDFDSPWGILYANTVSNSKIMQAKAAEIKRNDLVGVGEIIEAHALGTATSLWGDVPYTEVGNVEKFPQPKYDNQVAVYEQLIAKLDDALTKVDASTGTLSEATLFTDGANWVKVANTLKARYYLHTGKYEKAMEASMSGLLPGEDWMANHDVPANVNGKFNLIFSFCLWYREGYMTAQDAHLATILDTLNTKYVGNAKTIENKRFGFYYNQRGWYGANYDPNWWVGGKFWRAEPYGLVTGEENLLIYAEAAARSKTGDAVAALNGVRQYLASRYEDTYDDYEAVDFGPDGMLDRFSGDIDSNVLYEILLERYKCLYGQIEGFNDTRRTDNFIGVPINKEGSSFPERLIYPQSEINSNTNCPGAISLFEPTEVNK